MYSPEKDPRKVAELEDRIYRLEHPAGDVGEPHMPNYGEGLQRLLKHPREVRGLGAQRTQVTMSPLADPALATVRSLKMMTMPC